MNECINLIPNKESKWEMPYSTVFVNIYMKENNNNGGRRPNGFSRLTNCDLEENFLG